jgi:hypothetical protein
MQNLELAYLAVAYGMTAIMMYTSRHTTFPTVSHIALGKRLNRHVFFWGLLLSALLFAALMYTWAIPYFELGKFTQALVLLLIVSQILTGYYPVDSGKYRRAHLIFALTLGLCMLGLVINLAITPAIDSAVRCMNGVLAVAMIAILVHGKYTSATSLMKHEQIFFGLWHLAILVTVYLG